MKLHSINQENKTAIIDHQGQLIEVEWWLDNNKIVYFEEKSWDKLSHSGLDPRDVLNLIRNHLASAPKHGAEEVAQPNPEDTQYSAYEIDVSDLSKIDIYEICERFKMLDYSGRRHHALKKIILAGTRTGKKPAYKDIKEARDTLTKWLNANG